MSKRKKQKTLAKTQAKQDNIIENETARQRKLAHVYKTAVEKAEQTTVRHRQQLFSVGSVGNYLDKRLGIDHENASKALGALLEHVETFGELIDLSDILE